MFSRWLRLLTLLLLLVPAAVPALEVAPGPGASAGGASGGLGTGGTSSTSIVSANGGQTAFGNLWFTGGAITTSPTAGLGCVYLSDLSLSCVGQQAGSATNIRVYNSNDGGRTLPLQFTTSSTPGNLNATGQLVRSATGQYWLGLSANGATGNNPLVSPDLNIWTATSGVNIAPFAPTGTDKMGVGGPAGNTVIAITNSSTTRICRTVAPSTAFTCVSPAGYTGASGPTALAYVTGSTWLLIDNTAASIVFRSTDDGVTWTNVTTLPGTRSAIGNANLVCVNASVCIAQNGNTIYRSIDAGLTWSAPVVASGNADWQGIINFGGGNLMVLGSFLATPTAQPGCLPNCQNILGTAIRTVDGGITWVTANGPWMTIAGTGGPIETLIARPSGNGVVIHASNNNGPTNNGRDYGYTTTSPTGVSVLNHGEIPVAGPVQAGTLLNSQTTGAATTAVTVTLTGIAGFRFHVYEVSARCNTAAATATVLSVQDGATTIYSAASSTAQIVAATDFTKRWSGTGLTITDGNNAVITAGACSAGTTTLQIQADQF